MKYANTVSMKIERVEEKEEPSKYIKQHTLEHNPISFCRQYPHQHQMF